VSQVELWDQICTQDADGDVVHIIPVRDLVEHTVETACVCGPETQMKDETFVVAHWPLDPARS
jgi:hypothetical protein